MDEEKNAYFIWVPISCIEFLQPDGMGRVRRFKAAHLLHLLSNHVNANHDSEKAYEFKDLTRDYLIGHYTTAYIKNPINELLDFGFIEVNPAYSTTLHKSKSYRLNKALIKEVLNGNLQRVFFVNKPMVKRISEWRRETLTRHINKYSFIKKEAEMIVHLKLNISTLEYEFQQRLKEIRVKPLKRPKVAVNNAYRHKYSIMDLLDAKDLLDARVRYISGRVYHPFVQCPKAYRNAVVDDQGQPYVEVDLRSSQAVFLCHVIATAINLNLLHMEFGQPIVFEHDLLAKIEPHILGSSNLPNSKLFPSDFTAFVTAVFQDDIYEEASPENLQQNLNIEVTEGVVLKNSTLRVAGTKNLVGEERDNAKRKFFREVFFNHYREENKLQDGRVITKKPYVQDFLLSYPTVFEFCRICAFQSNAKKKKSRDLSLFLQKVESTFFHEIVGTRISKELDTNFFIVHDAVYCEEQHKNRIINIFKDEAQKLFGYSPLFR